MSKYFLPYNNSSKNITVELDLSIMQQKIMLKISRTLM